MILIVEDDIEINNLLTELLTLNNYLTVSAFSGTEALHLLTNQKFEMVLLDLMLPKISGEQILEEIRKKQRLPIIIISARTEIELKIAMLKLGADDYITKPFYNDEVLARIEANLRRYAIETEKLMIYKDIVLNPEEKLVTVSNKPIVLTSKEYRILKLMISYPNKIFSKANIFESVWEEEYAYDDNTINAHMSNIRKKLKQININEEYIETIWSMGYKLK